MNKTEKQKMYCMNCGKSVSPTQKHCSFCGDNQISSLSQQLENNEAIDSQTQNKSPIISIPSSNLKNCSYCKKEIAKTALTCPHCGGETEAKNKVAEAKAKGLVSLIFIALGTYCAYLLITYFLNQNCMKHAIELGVSIKSCNF
jgi:predicted RNA-binding Zn-ribbon protein involved in translation (DUF1610 family)